MLEKQKGKRFYNSAVPCKNGHTGLRYMSNRGCVQCAKSAKRRKKQIVWREENIEAVKQKDKQYALKNKQHIQQQHKDWYQRVAKQRYCSKQWVERRKQHNRARYERHKQQQLAQIYAYFKTLKLTVPDKPQSEALFKTYIGWLIVNKLNTPVATEYTLPGTKMKIDVFVPSLGCGIEVKLETPNWTRPYVKRQQQKYEKVLGRGNVLVVSPGGRFQHTPESVIVALQNLRVIEQ